MRPVLTREHTVATRMTHRPVSVRAGASYHDVATILAGSRIGAVPVLDERGRLVGAVSEPDIVRAGLRAPRELATLTAHELMTGPPATVAPDVPLVTAARMLGTPGVRRLFVVEDGRLVGVLSRRDLLRGYARDDDGVRAEVERAVRAALPGALVRAAVEDGVVLLTGRVQWRADLAEVEPVVRAVPGVVDVRNRLGFVWDDRDGRHRR